VSVYPHVATEVDQLHLGWDPPLRRLFGHSSLLRGIDVYVDFSWETLIGHSQRTFTNYMSLGDYVRRQPTDGKKYALVLTEQSGRPEGRYQDHPLYKIFVVNIQRYRAVAKNDAAGAYFAGLQGAPIIDAANITGRKFNQEETRSLLDALGTSEAVTDWLRGHPSHLATVAESIGDLLIPTVQTSQLTEELGRRLPAIKGDDIPALTALVGATDFPDNILRSAHLAKRKQVVDEFRARLDADRWSEKEWQAFFEREDWIFGHGLLYQFVHVIERETLVGGKEMSNKGGQVADFSVRTIGAGASFIALVDIKTPSARLVKPTQCRNGAHAIESDLAEAVAQILSNCDVWTREGSNQIDNVRRAARERWQTAQPRGILVLGNLESLVTDDARQSFELFRRHLHGLEIITFDELLFRASALAGEGETAAHERNLALAFST
jgi:hypothetical protein